MNDEAEKSGNDPLEVLTVIDRLEVGPVEIQPEALSAPYKVVRGEHEESFELQYRWEEKVFDPEDPGDRNLASMIAAQVALNYGLFCRELVFHGPYDAADRRFLREMLANTSREIYVLKFLRPNPFLRGPAAELPAVKRRNYTRAALRFEPASPKGAAASAPWEVDLDRWLVLSSGGKDSLVSYGLLAELEREAHPVFLNESGRHWFTALNAHRWFKREVETTARVWTNCDRLFSWMLRHLPFVREDFARVRADIYPVRLWTVAVFLFGALPLAKKRGLGRLIVGDEYDTTVREHHEGILHYAGLFDQSRYFDHALSRYFGAKGWALTQHSLLRTLSELLIERTLAARYPHLLRLQVSCHAAHTEGEGVRPCGKCEKCRRIVGLLLASGHDPSACGYTPEQVAECRRLLAEKGVHQDRPDAEHLAHLLHERGVIPSPRLGEVEARERPEVESLRFHPERSPIDEVPRSLRRGLYALLLEEARGAVKREGRKWLAFDPLTDEAIDRPHPFEPAPPSRRDGMSSGAGVLWGEMTWPEAESRLEKVDVALLPVGAVEQHGPHLPLDVDAFDADHLARLVAEACSEPKPLVLPLIPYGVSYHHEDFPGTLSVGNETLARLVYEVGMSAVHNGIEKLVIINGHGGNGPALEFAAQMINRDAHVFTCVDSGETSDADIYALCETANDVHAGEIETSTTLAVRPELVKMEHAAPDVQKFSSHYLDFTGEHSIGWFARTAKISESGVMGDPTRASREKGERIWRIMVDHLVELVEHLKALSLDEIHQRRH